MLADFVKKQTICTFTSMKLVNNLKVNCKEGKINSE